MFRGARVAVVVPAFNEADKVAATVSSVPSFIDDVIVVDDGSGDDTAVQARQAGGTYRDQRHVEVVRHPENRGVGAALVTGYCRALERGADIVTVMAGDGQMDPADLPRLLGPLVAGVADYVKGNRLAWPSGWRCFPLVRFVGCVVLSWLTRVATGYSRVFDSQCGYTAISRRALLAVNLERMYPRYGYPNDLLGRLADVGARVIDVPVRPVYGTGWRSGLRPWAVALPLTRILLAAFGRRVTRHGKPRALVADQVSCASDS